MPEKRSMQIIRHHYAVESAGRKGPGPGLDVRNVDFDPACCLESTERRLVAIDADHGETQRPQIAQVPALAAGDVEDAPAGPNQPGPATYPRRGRVGFVGGR